MKEIENKTILGIDPGTNVLGYSIIKTQGNKIELIEMGVLRLGKIEDMNVRMKVLFESVSNIIEKYKPNELSIEATFFGKNVQSMLKLGRAQGLCIAAAINKGLDFFEYSPRKIKQSVTGNGASSKEQVALMLQRLIGFEEIPKNLDETDALAVAVCHSYQNTALMPPTANNKSRSKSRPKSSSSWAAFINDNPDRVN